MAGAGRCMGSCVDGGRGQRGRWALGLGASRGGCSLSCTGVKSFALSLSPLVRVLQTGIVCTGPQTSTPGASLPFPVLPWSWPGKTHASCLPLLVDEEDEAPSSMWLPLQTLDGPSLPEPDPLDLEGALSTCFPGFCVPSGHIPRDLPALSTLLHSTPALWETR